MRCPFCGDSQSNPRDAHFYLKCDFETDEPILYNCFKGNCKAKGIVNPTFLKMLGIEIEGAESLGDKIYNKFVSFKNMDINVVCGSPSMNSRQVRYIEERLGPGFTLQDYERFKIVWDARQFQEQINYKSIIIPANDRHVSFLSTDKAMLLSRSLVDSSNYNWIKTRLFKSPNFTEYTISTDVDIFTEDDITVSIGEGVFDVLSAYKNFNSGENSLYLAVLGSHYELGVQSVISKGIIGKNVHLRIYLDSNIHVQSQEKIMSKYKWIFGSIKLFVNIIAEDIGKVKEKIRLREIKI
jgi:hypothetical protein